MSDANELTLRMVTGRDHLPPAAAAGPPDCLRPYVNERLNSRLARTLPSKDWKVRWRASLPASSVFVAILHSSGRTLVPGRTDWLLFDDKGHQLATEGSAGEDAQIDPQRSAFYVVNRFSNIASHRLANGAAEYRFRVEGTEDYSRTFIDRSESVMTVASFKRAVNPMNPAPVKVSALEVYEFTEPPRMDEDQLSSIEQRAIRHYEVPRLWTAAHGKVIIVALTNTIEFLDPGLKLLRSFAGSFEPLGMSLDEGGRIHILVNPGGKQALWLVSPRGEVVAVPLEQAVFQRPPVIGYDHTAYLLGAGHVLAVAENGTVAWNYSSKGRVSGAMALPDNRLLVSAGNSVFALNQKGDAAVVHEFPGETLTLPPVLTGSGELLAATQNHLYCLAQ